MINEDIRDIRGVLSVFDLGTLLFIILVIIILFIVAYFVFKTYQNYRRKKIKSLVVAKPEKPFQALALDELNKLDPVSYFEKGLWKEYYFAITEIVRVFLAKNYLVETFDRTSWEIIQLVERVERDLEKIKLLDAYFQAGDLVKFAKYQPRLPEMREAKELSLKLVKECYRPRALS